MKMYLKDKLGEYFYVKDCDCFCHVIFKHCYCDCDKRGFVSEYDITGNKDLVYPDMIKNGVEKIKIELDKETIEFILMELLEPPFSSYVGEKQGLKNTEAVDVYAVKEDDWEHINLPWAEIKPYKKIYYEILKQVKK